MEQLETTLPIQARASADGPKRKILDWLKDPHLQDLTPFQRFVVDLDWTKSPLGPISTWEPHLRQMALLVFSDPTPAVIYWGDGNTIVYNEAYTHLIGQKHPSLQGQDPKVGFAEVWDHFEKLLSSQRETGETTLEANAPLLFFRHEFFEETYFSWKFVPVIGPEGWVIGSHATVVEVTREIISDRRMATVRALSRQVSNATTINALWTGMIRGLEDAEKDVPLAMLYSVSSTTPIASKVVSSTSSNKSNLATSPPLTCFLEAAFGIPKGHALAPAKLESATDPAHILLSWMYECLETFAPVNIPFKPEIQDMLKGLTWRGFGIPSNSVVVCPIIPINSRNISAFLIIALSPRRPYDEDYRSFIDIITRQVTTPQLSTVILREEVARTALAARQEAMDRERLYKELFESESKFARLTQRAPIGLAILKPDGTAQSANDLWRDLTQLQVGSSQVNWEEVLTTGELAPVLSAWKKMITEKHSVTMQTTIRRPWEAPDLDRHGKEQIIDTHILLAMHPDLDEYGEITNVMSCVTDITSLKWSESQLRRRMDQAIEMKKQQERFIDMTSHEMRNPLSALIGCADEIIGSLGEYRSSLTTLGFDRDNSYLIDEAIEAADTIIYCAMHQKRIIDDILTLSRLDSQLLLVSPVPSQPIELVRSALKMFEAELKRADIKLDCIERQSLLDLQVDWTLLDPSRVLQVLINILTNAIKFTRTESIRYITITIGASLIKPSEANEFGVQYVQKSSNSLDQTAKSEWGDGEVIYLSIAVTDTGRGLSEKEKKNLFHLFKQASPKTYTQYGGSGLGLFISRQLTEMQGGEIGVASVVGRGSTFEFYIKTRRTTQTHTLDTSEKQDFQLLVREDALREACGTEDSAFQNGIKMPNHELESIVPTSAAPQFFKSFSILVVEDNLVNQKVVSKQLRKAGHVVNVANHGEEALDFIKRSEYWHTFATGVVENGEPLSVILMDLEMPVMDGTTCVRKIREFQSLGKIRGHVPIIAVTANARKDQIVMSLEAGMDDVTTKPYRLQDMLKQIEKLVAKYKTGGEPNSRLQTLSPVIDK